MTTASSYGLWSIGITLEVFNILVGMATLRLCFCWLYIWLFLRTSDRVITSLTETIAE